MATYLDRLRAKAEADMDYVNYLEALIDKGYEDFVEDTLLSYVSDTKPTRTVYLNVSTYTKNPETDEYETGIDETATAKNIRLFKEICNNRFDKEFNDDQLVLRKEFSTWILKGIVDRKIVCKPKTVKKEWVEPYTTKGYFREVVEEWDCHTPLLEVIAPELEQA